MNILLADDHDLVRDGITSFLKLAAPEVEVAQAKDFAEALAVVDGETPVELTILDLNMPGMNGLSGLTVVDDDRVGLGGDRLLDLGDHLVLLDDRVLRLRRIPAGRRDQD